MARTPSAMDAPFHPDIGFLAPRRRGLLRNPHKAQAQARRLSLRRRPASRDQPLPRRAQSAIEGLHLDRRSRRNHRRSQARAPSVRFDPLATKGMCDTITIFNNNSISEGQNSRELYEKNIEPYRTYIDVREGDFL